MTTRKSGSGSRTLKTRVRKPRNRTNSSQAWLERQLNDPYVQRARAEGYRARAAYKLIEIDDRFSLLKPGQRVVDLGAAPGGWSQVAARRVGVMEGKGRVVALDRLEMDAIQGVSILVCDFLDEDAPEKVKALLGGPADIVLSDMAANAVGHRQTDHLRTMVLVEAAAEFSLEVLKEGGAFLTKILRGGGDDALLKVMKPRFESFRIVKPAASRPESREQYALFTGFRPRKKDAEGQAMAEDNEG